MPLEHKASVFDYARFADELKPILEEALATQAVGELIRFIEMHLADLRHPDEATPLPRDWQRLIEQGDPNEYGDIALTRYYKPYNIGIGYEWQEVQDIIGAARPNLQRSPILGDVIGPASNPFDPGKLGAYFQSPDLVLANLALLRELAAEWGEDLLASAVGMLEEAATNRAGLYVTF
jgi:hypothetical protein